MQTIRGLENHRMRIFRDIKKFKVFDKINAPDSKYKLLSSTPGDERFERHQLSGYDSSELNSKGKTNKLLNNSFTCDNFKSNQTVAYQYGPSNPHKKHHDQRKQMSVTAYHRLQNLKPQIQGNIRFLKSTFVNLFYFYSLMKY